MAANKWPLDRNLPDPPRAASMANSGGWVLDVWRDATGHPSPKIVEGPFLPPDEMRRLMIALGRKTPPDAYMASFR